jgi:hypothetical protein
MSNALATLDQAAMASTMTVAKQLAESALIPRALFKKPGDVLVVLLTGAEFGLAPMQAIRGIHVIEGKPVLSADLMVGLCLSRKDICEYFRLIESTKQKATYETKRVGSEPVPMTWTWEQAVNARLTNKDNWAKYPDAMLRARCASALARAVYADLLGGCYETDEGDEIRKAPDKPKTQKRGTEDAVVEAEPTQVPAEGEVKAPQATAPKRVTIQDEPTTEKKAPVMKMGPKELKGVPLSQISTVDLLAALKKAATEKKDPKHAGILALIEEAERDIIAELAEREMSDAQEKPPATVSHGPTKDADLIPALKASIEAGKK